MPLLKSREACLAAAKSSLQLLLQFQSIIAEATQECGTKAKSDKLFVKVTLLELPWKHSYSLTEGMKRESFYFTSLSSFRIKKMQDSLLEPMKNWNKTPALKQSHTSGILYFFLQHEKAANSHEPWLSSFKRRIKKPLNKIRPKKKAPRLIKEKLIKCRFLTKLLVQQLL